MAVVFHGTEVTADEAHDAAAVVQYGNADRLAFSGGRSITGWQRHTTGTPNVASTDWVANVRCYGLNRRGSNCRYGWDGSEGLREFVRQQ